MKQILLLTKNVQNEQEFECKLRRLGHDVFTSYSLINDCIQDDLHYEFLSTFHFIILSETIENADISNLVKVLRKYPVQIIRKTDEELTETQYCEWRECGIHEWVDCSPNIEVLREKLGGEKKVFSKRKKIKKDITTLSLSKGEMKLIYILFNQRSDFLSREELSMKMWGKKKTDSTMSQLSTMVKKINQKLREQEIDGPVIETLWGKGYRLHGSVFDQLKLDFLS